jgi:mRNA interferase MazF
VTVLDIQTWQVWWVQLNPQLGREQAGRRPAIVVGTELACRIPNNLVIVVPCTHTDRGLPWQPHITLGMNPGVAMCDHVKAVDKRRFYKPHSCGSLVDRAEREAVAGALRELVTVRV